MNYFSLLSFLLDLLSTHDISPLENFFTQIWNFFQQNNDIVAIIASVATVLTIVVRLIDKLAEIRRKEAEKPIKLSIEIDGKQVSIEAKDADNAAELAKRFQELHPEIASKVTPQSKIKVSATIPKKSERSKDQDKTS